MYKLTGLFLCLIYLNAFAQQPSPDHSRRLPRSLQFPDVHCNAIFIEDANKMLISDSVEVFREAKRQHAFTFWNHPMWTAQRPDGMSTLTSMHKMLINEHLLDGIEVANDGSYSDEALQIALDNDLTIMGTSDIHQLVDWTFDVPRGGHRPITLVFVKDSTVEGIREGLFNKRTVAAEQREIYPGPVGGCHHPETSRKNADTGKDKG